MKVETPRFRGVFRLKTNSRTAKMRKILRLSCEHIKTLIQKFREAENGFPKAFLLTSSPDAYRTLCEHFVVHHRDALLVFALRHPCRSYAYRGR